jgi:tRNA uridine 5-carbamoylmethylation protein Kti12
MKKVYILSGIPGAGKSEYAKTLIQNGGETISTNDFYVNEEGVYQFDPAIIEEVNALTFEKFLDALEEDFDTVVVDNTNLYAWQISPYTLAAAVYGYEVEVHRLICDSDTAYRRQIHGVPLQTFGKMAFAFNRKNVLRQWECVDVYQNDWSPLTEVAPA